MEKQKKNSEVKTLTHPLLCFMHNTVTTVRSDLPALWIILWQRSGLCLFKLRIIESVFVCRVCMHCWTATELPSVNSGESLSLIHSPTHTLAVAEIQTVSCAHPLAVPATHEHAAPLGSLWRAASRKMSGAFLHAVIKSADTFASKPPLEYHLSEVELTIWLETAASW